MQRCVSACKDVCLFPHTPPTYLRANIRREYTDSSRRAHSTHTAKKCPGPFIRWSHMYTSMCTPPIVWVSTKPTFSHGYAYAGKCPSMYSRKDIYTCMHAIVYRHASVRRHTQERVPEFFVRVPVPTRTMNTCVHENMHA